MFKSIVQFVSVSLIVLTSLIGSQALASAHKGIPNAEDPYQYDLAYYERKQDRCLEAFTRSDFEVAYSICTPLASLGFSDAQLVTGLLYAYGEGVDKDKNRAKFWLKEALKNGREDAARALSDFGMD